MHPDAKHHVVLSKHIHLSKLKISDIHYKNALIGRKHTLCLLRNKYWITACSDVIRKILSNCLYCKRVNLRPKTQIMANLPKERLLIYDKPFASTGVDYFGPSLVKHSNTTRQNQALTKRYGVIYTSLTAWAIHLELAGDLSTDSLTLSLRGFISRRGHVKIKKSDNGTDFVGEAMELRERLSILDQIKVVNFITMKDIEWRFSLPLCSLESITNARTITEELLTTLLCEVERILTFDQYKWRHHWLRSTHTKSYTAWLS